MFKKLNIRTLLVVFVLLLAMVAIIEYSNSKKGDRSFRDQVLSFEEDKVTEIVITDFKNQGEQLTLEKAENDRWKVLTGEKEYNGDGTRINELLSQLNGMEPISIVATTEEQWKEYEVTDSVALLVSLKEEGKELADLYIGKFSYKQPQGQTQNPYQRRRGEMTSYVRVDGEERVFAVEGFLRMNFNPEPTAYRDKTVIASNQSNWTKLEFSYPSDSSFTLNNQENNWMVDGLAADSSNTASYLSNVSNLTSSSFVSEDELTANAPTHQLTINGVNLPAPIEIKAFPASSQDTVNNYYITSSENKGTYFAGNKQDLFDKIFKSKDNFLIGK